MPGPTRGEGEGTGPRERGLIASCDGTRLFFRRVRTPDPPRGRVVVVHGFGSHSGRHVRLLGDLARAGWEAWAPDLRGFGRSWGPRATVGSFDDYLDDVEALLGRVREEGDAGRPTVLLGHSMGGLVTVRLLQERDANPAGVVLSSPFLALRSGVSPVRRALARVLSRVAPDVRLAAEVDPATLCRDPAVVEAYENDPLVVRETTPRWWTETVKAQERAMEAASRVAVPVLLLVGESDPLADPAAMRRFHERLEGPGHALRSWPELLHEVLQEPERDRVVQAVLHWMARVAGGRG